VMDWIEALELAAAAGQSSWGPTAFAIFPSQAEAQAALDRIGAAAVAGPSLRLSVVGGRNSGAVLLDRRSELPLS